MKGHTAEQTGKI